MYNITEKSMNHTLTLMGLVVLLLAAPLCFSQTIIRYDFNSKRDSARFQNLTQKIRCVVCQNQSIADSNAGVAEDLKNSIHRLISDGLSDEQILKHLEQRYGEFIFFSPTVALKTYVLWFSPFLILILGLLGIIRRSEK